MGDPPPFHSAVVLSDAGESPGSLFAGPEPVTRGLDSAD